MNEICLVGFWLCEHFEKNVILRFIFHGFHLIRNKLIDHRLTLK